MTVYVCAQCMQQIAKWIGRCPGCGAWGTMAASDRPIPSYPKDPPPETGDGE